MADDTYEKALEKDGRDLVALARAGKLGVVGHRDAEIAAVLAEIDRGRPVLLVGPSGVGKTSVLRGVAMAMAARGSGGLYEISTALLLAGTRYIGEWQTKVTQVANAASALGAGLYITDAWNMVEVGRTSSSNSSMLDAVRPFLESGRLRLVAEASPEVLRLMQRAPGFVALFHAVEIAPLPEDRVHALLDEAATRAGAEIDLTSRRSLIQLTSRFLAARPQPGPALALLGEVIDYQREKRGINEDTPITPSFVEHVFSITSGLPPFVVSRGVVMAASAIRAWFADRIVGQLGAIDAVVETIALFKAGLHDPQRPIGTFLFVGPTGVGKTELARSLAAFLFGSPQRLLRFDLSEFKDYSAFELLIGDPERPNRPARLIDPVRAHPFQVVLFDELEKAHPNLWDLLLPLLDEGRLSAPSGDTVDFRNTILIATSNVGAQVAEKALGFGSKSDEDREAKVRSALEAAFRPEFLNRFQHVVVFHRLSSEEMRRIARQEMARVLAREGITGRNLIVDVEDEALDLVIREGIDERFGARALKREVQRRIVLPVAMTLMEHEVLPDSLLKISARHDKLQIRVVETAEARVHRQELAPPRTPDGRVVTRADLVASIAAIRARLEALNVEAEAEELEASRRKLARLRRNHGFWKEDAESLRNQRDLARIATAQERLRRLAERVEELAGSLRTATSRAAMEDVAARARALDDALGDAYRELVVMGWDGSWDALVEVRPVGGSGREARDLLVELYLGWAAFRRLSTDWLREPREADEAALLAVKGPYVYGLLARERGLHRLRLAPTGDTAGRLVVAAVRVVPWTDATAVPTITAQRPLKGIGQYGGKIRSRLECEGLVLQSGRTIAENRELAAELVGSWAAVPEWSEEIVRRYDRAPPLIRDALTGYSSGRPDALAPRAFDTLLRRRVDAGGA